MFFKRKKEPEAPVLKKNKKVKIGFAFGGGGARGIGHIGVIKAFEELNIEADVVAGTSVGAIIGSFYASGMRAGEMEAIAKSLKVSDIKKTNFFFIPSSTQRLEETLLRIYGKDIVFSELKMPFSAVCVNMKDGQEVVLNSGSVVKSVCASSAVPGVFRPVLYRGMHLVDGGLSNNVPADIARSMGANIVIAIDVNTKRGEGTLSLKLTRLLTSTVGVMMQKNVETKLMFADVVLAPELSRFSSSKLGDVDKMIEAGYNAVMDNKEKILNLIKKKPKKKDKIIWQVKKQTEQ